MSFLPPGNLSRSGSKLGCEVIIAQILESLISPKVAISSSGVFRLLDMQCRPLHAKCSLTSALRSPSGDQGYSLLSGTLDSWGPAPVLHMTLIFTYFCILGFGELSNTYTHQACIAVIRRVALESLEVKKYRALE